MLLLCSNYTVLVCLHTRDQYYVMNHLTIFLVKCWNKWYIIGIEYVPIRIINDIGPGITRTLPRLSELKKYHIYLIESFFCRTFIQYHKLLFRQIWYLLHTLVDAIRAYLNKSNNGWMFAILLIILSNLGSVNAPRKFPKHVVVAMRT